MVNILEKVFQINNAFVYLYYSFLKNITYLMIKNINDGEANFVFYKKYKDYSDSSMFIETNKVSLFGDYRKRENEFLLELNRIYGNRKIYAYDKWVNHSWNIPDILDIEILKVVNE